MDGLDMLSGAAEGIRAFCYPNRVFLLSNVISLFACFLTAFVLLFLIIWLYSDIIFVTKMQKQKAVQKQSKSGQIIKNVKKG